MNIREQHTIPGLWKESRSDKNGLKTIYLGTTEKFLAAHRFYEKSGFELIEPESLPATFPRMAVDKRFYRLKIDVAA